MWRKDCGAIVSPIAEGKSAAVCPVPEAARGARLIFRDEYLEGVDCCHAVKFYAVLFRA